MRAFRVEQAEVAAVVEIPDIVTRDHEVLLRVEMVGICGTDLSIFRGRNAMVDFPRIPGHEVAAVVVSGGGDLAAGTAVTMLPYTSCGICPSCLRGRVNACQRNETMGVQRDGAMTEYITMPRSKLYTANLSIKELCLVEPLTVGFHAAARGRVTSEDVVAVFGCGGVGLGAIAASAFRGAETIGIDIDDVKLATARRAGAKHTVNTGREDLHTRLQEITAGRGPDIMIEAIGLPSTFRAAVEEVAFTGRVVYIGYAKEPVAYETRLFVQKELDILGSRNALPEDFREVIAMLEAGQFPVQERSAPSFLFKTLAACSPSGAPRPVSSQRSWLKYSKWRIVCDDSFCRASTSHSSLHELEHLKGLHAAIQGIHRFDSIQPRA